VPEVVGPCAVYCRHRTSWQGRSLPQTTFCSLRSQKNPCHAGIFYGRYWARTSDPQLVDSGQRSRQFAHVRPERMVESNAPASERERTSSVAIVATPAAAIALSRKLTRGPGRRGVWGVRIRPPTRPHTQATRRAITAWISRRGPRSKMRVQASGVSRAPAGSRSRSRRVVCFVGRSHCTPAAIRWRSDRHSVLHLLSA
jgi:hypothetical protein